MQGIGQPAAGSGAPPDAQAAAEPGVSALTDAIKDGIRDDYAKIRDGLAGFRPRAAQLGMIAEVARTLARAHGVAAIEAPTGTGKSMAYLLAGAALARAKKKHLLIATATVALQEQLVGSDVPQYLALTGRSARVALAKGRARYLCPRNLAQATQDLDADAQLSLDGSGADLALWLRPPQPADQATLRRLSAAFADGGGEWDGDLDHAPAPVSDLVRPMVTTSAGGCTGRRCAHYARCPFFAARRAVDDADIIVANQDLVLADLTMPGDKGGWGGVILPAPEDTLYVFDEAHHLAAKAIARGAAEVHLGTAARPLARLGRQVHAAYALTDKASIGRLRLEEGDAKLAELAAALEALAGAIHADWTPDPDERSPSFRGALGELPAAWVRHAQTLHLLATDAQRWITAVRRAVLELPAGGPTQESLARELGIALERLTRQAACWRAWSEADPPDAPPMARWVTLGNEGQLACHASAVSASGVLRGVLWDNAQAVVLTSATLAAGGDFRGLAAATGLPEDATRLSLPSPFDLAAQARLEVPAMRALPDARDAHADEVAAWLAAELDWDAGNLVLFTSRAKLDRVLQKLPLATLARVRVQGTQGKAQLIAAHRAEIEAGRGSTLFGLASFGEGLDLPGRLCETVVITQLPFAVPTDPVGATYAEWLESRGRNPFLEVSVPDATRILTQYCGRLIRSETDHGRIVLLDRRIVARRYGSGMLRALPPFRQVITRP